MVRYLFYTIGDLTYQSHLVENTPALHGRTLYNTAVSGPVCTLSATCIAFLMRN